MATRAAEPAELKSTRYRLVEVVGDERDLRLFLSRFPTEIKGVSPRDNDRLALRLVLPEEQIAELPGAKLGFDAGLDLTELGERLRKLVGPGNFDPVLRTLGLTLPDRLGYLDCDAVAKATKSLAKAYPSHCRLIELEPTALGTPCQALSIFGMAPPGAPAILVLGGMHACEWGGCEIALHFVERLLGAYTAPDHHLALGDAVFTADEVRQVLDTRQLVVFPLVNPDGREWSQSGMEVTWRKNRNPARSTDGDRGVGVDVNRNFDFLFELGDEFGTGLGGQVSADPAHALYQGPNPFSEAEARNIERLLDRIPAIEWLVDLHSGGDRKILYPWSVDETQSGNPDDSFIVRRENPQRGRSGDDYAEYMRPEDKAEYERLASFLARGMAEAGSHPYQTETGFSFAPSPGTCHDYAYSRHLVSKTVGKVLAFAVEWNKLWYPDWPEMQKTLVQVASGLMRFTLATRHPLP